MLSAPIAFPVGRHASMLWAGAASLGSPGLALASSSMVVSPAAARNFAQDAGKNKAQQTPQLGRRLIGSAATVAAVAVAVAGARSARAVLIRQSAATRVDSHLHLWTPDVAKYPTDNRPPPQLNDDGRATHESFVKTMDDTGVAHAVVVQPINYWQDYRYLIDAMNAHPTRLKGVFIADPGVGSPDACLQNFDKVAASHPGWAGVRFNPYKWPTNAAGMADEAGISMFRRAGELGLTVGFMPFKGLSKHSVEIESLIQASPSTRVVIDHWGFFLQPATGSGDRTEDDESWRSLLGLAKHPQVFVKVSALFRVAADKWPYASLSERLRKLIKAFGAERLMWGSDFPFSTEHGDYGKSMEALEAWPIWQDISEAERDAIMGGSALRAFGAFPTGPSA